MKFNIVSWNVRHLREDEAREWEDYPVHYFSFAHLVFLYENKGKSGDRLAKYLATSHEKYVTADHFRSASVYHGCSIMSHTSSL